jgi:hypothetical protein
MTHIKEFYEQVILKYISTLSQPYLQTRKEEEGKGCMYKGNHTE